VLICSPESAHGVPGTLKNALDWLVGSEELVGKPVAVLNLSERATRAHASLIETLHTMAARKGVRTRAHAEPGGYSACSNSDSKSVATNEHCLNGTGFALNDRVRL
jgi:NAD(P)H-dependent FMN reductase